MDRADRAARYRADTNLVGLEREQVHKRLGKYKRKTLGNLPREKPSGYKRFASLQLGGMATTLGRKVKLARTCTLIDDYDVDMVSMQELGINWRYLRSSETLTSFMDTEVSLRAVTAHNSYEGGKVPSPGQYGGTGIVAVEGMQQHARRSGKDSRNLGRWSWYTVEGSPSHRTRVITAYHVGKAKRKGSKTVYQQHKRYMENNNIDGEPYDLFCSDLLHLLSTWRDQGDRILLMMDANEHVLQGDFAQALQEVVGLDEISHRAWRGTEPHTFIDGSEPIDGVWASPELEIGGFAILSFRESVGDHSTLVFDVSTRSLIGREEDKVVRPECRRLNTKTSSLQRYMAILEEQMVRHRMEERLEELIASIDNDRPTAEQARKMEQLDRQFVELQRHAEKRCRRIYRPLLDFSPEVKLWYERMQSYKALIRWKQGKTRSSNVVRTALRRGIPHPRELSIEQLEAAVGFTRAEYHKLSRTHKELRRQFLRERIVECELRNQKTAAKRLRQQMDHESNRKMWFIINRSMKDPHRPAPHYVQRNAVDGVVTSRSQAETESFIFEETECRFHLAADAPISRTKLIDQIGYLADTDIAQQLIEGTYDIPDDVDDATALLLEEISRIGVQMTNGEMTMDITPEEFRYFWRRVKERTSSSRSGIHYGHYKAAAYSNRASSFLAKKITLISRSGVPPERWSYGLTVMLEKIAGLALVNKLRAILLMEADFNMHNKLHFGSRMLNAARAKDIIPQEQYSDKQSTAEDGTFDKILQSDIARQRRMPFAILSADAANCYDRIHHSVMALLFLALGVHTGAIAAMLRPIQMMKFFLRTGWGESTTFIGGDPQRIMHGMCQGNGASPAAWLVLSAIIVRAYKSLGFGCKLASPITRTHLDTMGVLYVDDTDLYIMRECLRTPRELWLESQDALTSWGHLLIATGGMLKPEKCFYYLVDFEFQADGTWQAVDVVAPPLEVPQKDGRAAPISQLPHTESQKTLGLWTNPAGDCTKQLEVLHDKMASWISRLEVGRLPAKWAWVSYSMQLWSKLRYGLGCNSSSNAALLSQEAEGGPFRRLHRRMLPLLGVNRNIKLGWRHLPSAFGGIGLRSLFHEVAISRVNMFLQHYETPTVLGRKLTATLEALQLEAGLNCCPLTQPYHPIGPLLTPSWIRSFWECLDRLQWSITIDYPTQPLPRESDALLLQVFTDGGVTPSTLCSLNRCRNYLGLLFLSDMTSADGRFLESRFLSPTGARRAFGTSLSFPRERPSAADWAAWRIFWEAYTGVGRTLPCPLGRWVERGHRQWEFYYDDGRDVIEQRTPDGVSYYMPALNGRITRGTKAYRLVSTHNDGRLPEGHPCTVACAGRHEVRYLCHGPRQQHGVPREKTFLEFLRSWGGDWMWHNVGNSDSTLDWLVTAIEGGTTVWVTDGSYNKEMAPTISGAGWVIYCTESNKRLYGNFYEQSPSAGSYRGELLGLLALHTLAAALEAYFSIAHRTAKLCCDNQTALYKSKEPRKRIPTGSSQGDIKRALRNVKAMSTMRFNYEWVESHQDRYKLWTQLTVEQRLNCDCDMLAKRAVTEGMLGATRTAASQLLPRERVAVIIDGVKQTSDVAGDARFTLGMQDAERLYTAPLGQRDSNGRRSGNGGLGWSREAFRSVDWRRLDDCLGSKPQMYRQWLSKQSSGFCGTQHMVARWDSSRDGRCPNCGAKEKAQHLMQCPDADRTRLLEVMADDFGRWLSTNHGHPELVYWIPRYIKLRGTRRLEEMPRLTHAFQLVARSQDLIPWRSFMEGKVATALFRLQEHYLTVSSSRLTIASWARQFLSRLLQITHAQWVFRNVTLHDTATGYLVERKREEILCEIDTLAHTDPADIPESRRYLLEIDFTALHRSPIDTQSYWLLSMKSAIRAGRRRGRGQRRIPSAASRCESVRTVTRPRRRRFRFVEAERLWTEIEEEWGLVPRRSRKRSSSSARFAGMPDNKRRRPD